MLILTPQEMHIGAPHFFFKKLCVSRDIFMLPVMSQPFMKIRLNFLDNSRGKYQYMINILFDFMKFSGMRISETRHNDNCVAI